MSDGSSEERPLHLPPEGQLRRLGPRDAAKVFAFLRDKDVRPAPCESDLALFLGRVDSAAFGAYAGARLTSMVACLLEEATLRIVRVEMDAKNEPGAARLLSLAERFAAARGVGVVFAQVAAGSQAHRLLTGCGYEEDFRETDVRAGRPVPMVDLVKPL